MNEALDRLGAGKPLDARVMVAAMEDIVFGRSNDADIERFLLLLRKKGETSEEIASAAGVMRAHAVKLSKPHPELLDTCGTGGDGQHTLNVSTLSALIACAGGVAVGKHGNRSVSSVCGSADLLEALGVRIDLSPQAIESGLDATGFAFFFAPLFHPATRFAMPARKKIQGKTLFNILGPLSNPAGATSQLLGVYDKTLVPLVAQALLRLGSKRALVVHGMEGLDEISIAGPTLVAEVRDGAILTYEIKPEDLGLERTPLDSLRCRTKEENVAVAHHILSGERSAGADMVCLNAGAAFYVAGRAKNIREGVALAQGVQRSGEALKKTEFIAEETRALAARRS